VATPHTPHVLFWFVLFAFLLPLPLLLLLIGFWAPVPAAGVAAICPFARFGRLDKIEGGNKGKVFWIA